MPFLIVSCDVDTHLVHRLNTWTGFFLKHGSTLQYKPITSLDNTITWKNKAVLGKANLDH